MTDSTLIDLKASMIQTLEAFTRQFVELAPQLIGGIALLLAGWVVARLLRTLTEKLVGGFDSIFKRTDKVEGARPGRMKRAYIVIVSRFVFWTVMLFFVAVTANMLGWRMFSGWMDGIIHYLPNLIAGLAIVLAGFLVGNSARAIVTSAAGSAGVEQNEILARIVQLVIFFTATLIGVEQIGINVHFLTTMIIVIIGILLAGGALAFGLGAKNLIANVIGAQYLRKHCRLGEQMQIGDVDGIIAEVTRTAIVLETEYGRTVVPAKAFHEQVSSFTSGLSDAAPAGRGDNND